ncbi:hypothetical protein [Bacillus toyonensis]|uniref:hypothetical protein n=1 Tax=Bacillus toyonensis TaxID=155322 RepID=UPI0015CF08A6|nr:hypothetical protein [Bacillus toyonensis]
MYKEDDYCSCKDSGGAYSVTGEWGYWDCCSDCEKKSEDGFHYYDEPEDIY